MNSRQRYNMKRMSEYNARKSEIKQYSQKIERAFSRLSEDCSNRVLKATLLVPVRDYQELDAIEHKRNRIFYSRPTHEMGVTCTGTQRIKGKSIPLI